MTAPQAAPERAAGLIALVAGWVTTEMGRQPWVIYGLLRTRDAVSLHSTLQMAISLLVFIVVYCAVFGVGYYYIFRLIKKILKRSGRIACYGCIGAIPTVGDIGSFPAGIILPERSQHCGSS